MKFLIHYTSIKPDINDVKKVFKNWGLDLEFEVKKSPILDESSDILYEKRNSIQRLLNKDSIFFSLRVLALFADDRPFILCLNADKTKQTVSIRGDHTFFQGKSLMTVYQKPNKYIKDVINKDGKETNRKIGWKRDTYVIVHEILHHLEKTKGKNELHKQIEKGLFEEYAKTICSWYSKTPKGVLPLVKRKADGMVLIMKLLKKPVRITSDFRSFAEQDSLYAQGRTKKGNIVTNAKGGESLHNYGCAVDFVFRDKGYNAPNEDWNLLGLIGKLLGFEWGGDWKGFVDKPHFQLTLGHSLKEFQSGKVDYTKWK